MQSLSKKIDHNIFLMHGIFNTYKKIHGKVNFPEEAGESLSFMLMAMTFRTKELIMIQSAIRKPNSLRMKYTRHQNIGLEFLLTKMKKLESDGVAQ